MSVFILQNVTKSFVVNKKDHVVLNNVNLKFPNNGFVSIIGKSGSGKSTLLNLLLGIDKPTSGKVLFRNKNISKFNDKQFSTYHLNHVSTVFQHYNLFDDLTALENIIIPLKMKGISTNKAKQLAEKKLNELSLGELANRKVSSLSGGEKQRIAIIRSIIIEPEVLLCDEPTGALDYKNSQEIMGILKSLSKRILVIMVSHNKVLVDKYSDYKVCLQDGQIVEDTLPKQLNIGHTLDTSKKKYKSDWINYFLKHNFRKNIIKNIFSIITCSFGFASLFLCIGFHYGSSKSYEEALTNNLSIGNGTVSKIDSVSISDSHFTYQKNIRPELYEVDKEFSDFNSIRVEENISYFISSCASCSYKGNLFTNFQMVPLYDFSLESYGSDLLVSGSGGSDTFEEVIVNEEFVNLIGDDILDKEIVIRNTASVNYRTYDEEMPFIQDQLNLEKSFKIAGIIKEFPFLNSPKIYYSYQGGRNFLKSEIMENLSYYLGFPYSFFNYLQDCEVDDVASSYSSYIFLNDLSEVDMFFERIKNLNNKTLEVTSTIAEIKDAYTTFISSFSKTLLVFSAIAFLGVNFVLGMISLSSFLENRKNAAILTCLGSRNSSVYRIHLFENYFLIVISYLFSLLLAILGQKVINPILSRKFSLSSLIQIPFNTFLGVRFGLIFILLGVIFVCSTIFTLVPMVFYRHGFITEELRDE